MNRTVLVIDDEPGVARMIKLMLDDVGYRVVLASGGRGAIENLIRESVDLVITDILMPEIEGIELIRHIKEAHPTVRVIAISGGGQSRNPDFLRFAQRLGADATLPKPFRREELLAVVAKILPPG